ncbi:MAG: IS66 family insertion sequence element accessory protein TnpA [Bradyrhizobium sp.]
MIVGILESGFVAAGVWANAAPKLAAATIAKAVVLNVIFLIQCYRTDNFAGGERDVVSSRTLRRGFWRAHHQAWLQSEFNQREYCVAYRTPLKAFSNWQARFKIEPQPSARKVRYWCHVVSHALSQGLRVRLIMYPGRIMLWQVCARVT